MEINDEMQSWSMISDSDIIYELPLNHVYTIIKPMDSDIIYEDLLFLLEKNAFLGNI